MKVGDIISNFILKDEKGNEFDLYKNLDTQILLVFYPKDDTPLCSVQLAEYNDNLIDFIEKGIKVIGISTDSVDSHSRFCSKLELKFPLLSDAYKKVSRQFGALNILGKNKRTLVLIGTDKKLLWTDSTLPINYIKTEEIFKKIDFIIRKEMT